MLAACDVSRLGRGAGRGLGCLAPVSLGLSPGGWVLRDVVDCLLLAFGAFTERGFGGCGVWREPAGTGGTARVILVDCP